jgi:AAA15 family ATPase/GTPase
MRYYLDNFRGFQDTYVELKNVNFLVGENSSGKTSLIAALTIMSNFRFWIEAEIDFDEFEFNSFEDLHSVNSTREYFSLGAINKNAALHLLSFINDDGLPSIFREIFYVDDNMLVIEFSREKIQYKQIYKLNLNKYKNPIKRLLDYLDSNEYKSIKAEILGIDIKTDIKRAPFYTKRYLIWGNNKIDKIFHKSFGLSTPFDIDNISFLAPIRAKPLPLYSGGKKTFSAEGDHTPFMLREKISFENRDATFLSAMNKYGKESGLFDGLDVIAYREEKTSPFELFVERNKSKYKISSVGYGVSQILPIISELLANQYPATIAIQQPEVHLHPRAQAAFGALLYKVAKKYKKNKFLVETHSDYIIDRFRYQKKMSARKVLSQILFFKSNGKHNNISVIDIKDDGKYPDGNLGGFRSFFVDESFRVMEI